jgi:vanillate O-demethylase ferredoxin subunit
MQVRIRNKIAAAQDICGFELVDPNGAPLPPFSAGAHIDVHVGGLVRQYSLCNSPAETERYVIGVLLEPDSRGGSLAMHALEEGELLEISAPKNHFPLALGAKHTLLIAGGIGITPLLAMAEQLAADGESFELHYATRSATRTAFRDRLAAQHLVPHTRLYWDDTPEARLDLAALLANPAAETHLYVCGPGGLIDAVLAQARAGGWEEAQLHREYFGAAPLDSAADGAFQVELAQSGRVVEVAAGQTVIAALRDCGLDVPTSCEQGVCGTCLTKVLAGEPEHLDNYLTAEERAQGCFLPCVSRGKGVLKLDL